MADNKSLADYVNGQLPHELVDSLEKGITASIPYCNYMGFARVKIEELLPSNHEYTPLFDLMQKGYDEVYMFDTINKKEGTECLSLGLFRSPDKKTYFVLFFEGLKAVYETRQIEKIMGLELGKAKIRSKPAYKEELEGKYCLANKYSTV
jgi:hypothetical protein